MNEKFIQALESINDESIGEEDILSHLMVLSGTKKRVSLSEYSPEDLSTHYFINSYLVLQDRLQWYKQQESYGVNPEVDREILALLESRLAETIGALFLETRTENSLQELGRLSRWNFVRGDLLTEYELSNALTIDPEDPELAITAEDLATNFSEDRQRLVQNIAFNARDLEAKDTAVISHLQRINQTFDNSMTLRQQLLHASINGLEVANDDLTPKRALVDALEVLTSEAIAYNDSIFRNILDVMIIQSDGLDAQSDIDLIEEETSVGAEIEALVASLQADPDRIPPEIRAKLNEQHAIDINHAQEILSGSRFLRGSNVEASEQQRLNAFLNDFEGEFRQLAAQFDQFEEDGHKLNAVAQSFYSAMINQGFVPASRFVTEKIPDVEIAGINLTENNLFAEISEAEFQTIEAQLDEVGYDPQIYSRMAEKARLLAGNPESDQSIRSYIERNDLEGLATELETFFNEYQQFLAQYSVLMQVVVEYSGNLEVHRWFLDNFAQITAIGLGTLLAGVALTARALLSRTLYRTIGRAGTKSIGWILRKIFSRSIR